ncbi:MAG: FtsX-like permease family protein [bacterium]
MTVAAVFAALFLAALAFYVRFPQPAERQHRAPFKADYTEDALLARLTPDGLDAQMAAIDKAGAPADVRQIGRLSGSPGFANTEKLILETFAEAGLSVTCQEFRVVVPVTDYCEVLGEDGKPLPDVQLFPFQPCGLTPTVLPESGLCGNLILAESTELKYLAGQEPSNSIVLTYLDSCGGWPALASVGVKAVIVMEDEESKKLRANPDARGAWENLFNANEVAYPRFFARGPLGRYAGQRLTLRCKVTWQERCVRNLVGLLRGAGQADEALVLTAFYDSTSVVPDLAPGAESAVSLAAFLQYVKALTPYQGKLKRDVLFVATAGHFQSLAGVSRLMESIGHYGVGEQPAQRFERDRQEAIQKLGYASMAQNLLKDGTFQAETHPGAVRSRWMQHDGAFRKWFEKRLLATLGEINLEFKEAVLTARLSYLRAGSPVFRDGFEARYANDAERADAANSHPLLRIFLKAQALDNRSGNLMALPLWELVSRAEFTQWRVRERLLRQMTALVAYHSQELREIDGRIAMRDLFARYARTLTLNLELSSGGHRVARDLSVQCGSVGRGSVLEPQSSELARAIQEHVPEKDRKPEFEVVSWGEKDSLGSPTRVNIHNTDFVRLESMVWALFGRMGFSVLNYNFLPPRLTTPEDTFAELVCDGVKPQIPVLGKTLLAVAAGRIPFRAIDPDSRKQLISLHGSVFGMAGTGAVYPTHPMAAQTFVRAYPGAGRLVQSDIQATGIRLYPVLKTNPYGEYHWTYVVNFNNRGWGSPFSVDAARFDDHGAICYYKNASAGLQSVYKNQDLSAREVLAHDLAKSRSVNVALFRSHHLEFFDQSNPKTMKGFRRVVYLTRAGLNNPAAARFDSQTAFVEPAATFYFGLVDSASDNDQLETFRAFLTNVDPNEAIKPGEPEIYGRGYLAADYTQITYPQIDAAESMLRTNEKRLRLQKQYGMADALMLDFHKRGREWLEIARQKCVAHDPLAAVLAAGKSLSYAINNHPVIRLKVSHAVIGILWYLFLLVPFVFFFEKLLFGFTDIRQQLLASGFIFLVVFGMLRLFHPAFAMVRSSIMILIGFIMLLLTLLVAFMVGGKFQQNIRDLRRKEGQVEGADINRGGVVGTALMLGLNNMRRRKVRTGLTCVTLVLITFVMICFTSVSSDLVNDEYATGRSPWNGLFLRNRNYMPLTDAEIAAMRQSYGQQFPVRVHSWLTGSLWDNNLQNAEIVIDREFTIGDQKVQKRATVSASVQTEWNEPQFSGLDRKLTPGQRWFPRPPATRAERLEAVGKGLTQKLYVVIPDSAAKQLGIAPEELTNTNVVVTIRGDDYEVLGIFDSLALNAVVNPDGKSILPYDLNAVQTLGKNASGQSIVPEDTRPLTASQVIFVNRQPAPKGGEQTFIASCSVLFPKEKYQLQSGDPVRPAVGFKEQRRLVLDYLERSAAPAYYAISGVTYYGSRMRTRTLAGVLELLIPILIAALTVFNTMRGSVYERRDEIYVYNAVGIAPNHVFFMFMAEACVYAVVGAMLGYLLSQASGRVLMALHMTGGLNMNYSSIETIYASLAIVAAVLLSTILPARSAARLAAPAETREWKMPPVVDDTLSFNLPFTFTQHDRVAATSYFCRWLDAHGEGSAGPFFCGPPKAFLRRGAGATGAARLTPGIEATVWMKPYDLGVSHRMEITLPIDPETQEYVAQIRLTRLSGTLSAWERTTKVFLGILRKQFLNWRAATLEERAEMFGDARKLLLETPIQGQPHG